MSIPFAAVHGDLSGYLTALFLLLLAAKIGEEICRHLHQPVVAGEILAGVIVGPSVLGLVELNNVVEVFAELGVIFLLFWVGLETKISQIASVGRSAALVGVVGVVLPAGSGVLLALVFGASTATAVFIGAALAATSVGITSALLMDLKLQSGRAARTILGAAVIDDILALIVLAMATGIATGGSVDLGDVGILFALAVPFLVFVSLGGSRVFRRWPKLLEVPRFADSPLMPAVIICLGLAVLSAEIGLAAVIGAFLAGMVIAETRDHNSIESEVAPIYAFFAPFFFTAIGVQVDISSFTDGDTLLLLGGVTLLAVVTKYAGAWIGSIGLDRRDRAIVAAGMVPRGEVGIIVAGIGFSEGVIRDELFAVVVGMAVLTTLIAPYMLKSAARRRR
ncbi:MAG: cation:proton antiporter [Actinobacteria bacterium]|nr:cation:proton antiporter [Actinomycetota bacterium]